MDTKKVLASTLAATALIAGVTTAGCFNDDPEAREELHNKVYNITCDAAFKTLDKAANKKLDKLKAAGQITEDEYNHFVVALDDAEGKLRELIDKLYAKHMEAIEQKLEAKKAAKEAKKAAAAEAVKDTAKEVAKEEVKKEEAK